MNLLLERDKTEPLPPVLFHYTGSDALLSILGNNCLWATSARYMNDSTEYSHGMDLIDPRLHRDFLGIPSPAVGHPFDDFLQRNSYSKPDPAQLRRNPWEV
jgi:hypothetical protein